MFVVGRSDALTTAVLLQWGHFLPGVMTADGRVSFSGKIREEENEEKLTSKRLFSCTGVQLVQPQLQTANALSPNQQKQNNKSTH